MKTKYRKILSIIMILSFLFASFGYTQVSAAMLDNNSQQSLTSNIDNPQLASQVSYYNYFSETAGDFLLASVQYTYDTLTLSAAATPGVYGNATSVTVYVKYRKDPLINLYDGIIQSREIPLDGNGYIIVDHRWIPTSYPVQIWARVNNTALLPTANIAISSVSD